MSIILRSLTNEASYSEPAWWEGLILLQVLIHDNFISRALFTYTEFACQFKSNHDVMIVKLTNYFARFFL